MYQNFYYDRKNGLCHLWTDEQGKEYQVFPYEEYAYQIDPKGEFETLTGLRVKKVKSWSPEAVKQGLIFEHDVLVPTRVLIDRYYDSDEPSINHRTLFFDIEVEKGLRYSTPKDASNRITSIAYYISGQYTVLILDQSGTVKNGYQVVTINGEDYNVKIEAFPNEILLLTRFVKI